MSDKQTVKTIEVQDDFWLASEIRELFCKVSGSYPPASAANGDGCSCPLGSRRP